MQPKVKHFVRRVIGSLTYDLIIYSDLGDPIGENHVTPNGFGHMTHMLKTLANGKLILALEVINAYNVNLNVNLMRYVKIIRVDIILNPYQSQPLLVSRFYLESHQVK